MKSETNAYVFPNASTLAVPMKQLGNKKSDHFDVLVLIYGKIILNKACRQTI